MGGIGCQRESHCLSAPKISIVSKTSSVAKTSNVAKNRSVSKNSSVVWLRKRALDDGRTADNKDVKILLISTDNKSEPKVK